MVNILFSSPFCKYPLWCLSKLGTTVIATSLWEPSYHLPAISLINICLFSAFLKDESRNSLYLHGTWHLKIGINLRKSWLKERSLKDCNDLHLDFHSFCSKLEGYHQRNKVAFPTDFFLHFLLTVTPSLTVTVSNCFSDMFVPSFIYNFILKNKLKCSLIYSSFVTTYPLQGCSGAGANPRGHWTRVGFTLQKLPVHHKADIVIKKHSHSHLWVI